MVRVRDCFEVNNTAYIVMDYEDGEPLDALLERHGTLTEAQLNRVLSSVVDGLRQVHAAGFLHRDIKPANIFVRRSTNRRAAWINPHEDVTRLGPHAMGQGGQFSCR